MIVLLKAVNNREVDATPDALRFICVGCCISGDWTMLEDSRKMFRRKGRTNTCLIIPGIKAASYTAGTAYFLSPMRQWGESQESLVSSDGFECRFDNKISIDKVAGRDWDCFLSWRSEVRTVVSASE